MVHLLGLKYIKTRFIRYFLEKMSLYHCGLPVISLLSCSFAFVNTATSIRQLVLSRTKALDIIAASQLIRPDFINLSVVGLRTVKRFPRDVRLTPYCFSDS